jgi:hypothetical protein
MPYMQAYVYIDILVQLYLTTAELIVKSQQGTIVGILAPLFEC